MALKWWVTPVVNLVGSAVFGLIMMCMFCMCGYLICSRTTAALVLLVSLVVPLAFVLTLRITWKLWKAKEKGRFAVALALLVLALFPDFMYATAACRVGTKVVGIGREFFADGLELPFDGQYEAMPEYTEACTNLLVKADGLQTNVCETSLTVYAFGREHPRRFDAWINPGESGTVVLRVNEVTTGKPVIKERLYPFTCKVEGEAKQRLSDEIPMLPGRSGKSYAACFELWFRAPNNVSERLLTCRVYRVSGAAH